MKRSRVDEIAAKLGIPIAADDDQRYREEVPTNPELCPFCGSESCQHHAVSLDQTFEEIVGGALYEACNAYVQRITDSLAEGEEDLEGGRDAFARLQEILDASPGAIGVDGDWDCGPGRSSSMRHYWVEDAEAMKSLASHIKSA